MARNKSENPDAWIAELIAFAKLIEGMGYREDRDGGFPLRTAKNALSPVALEHYNPTHRALWSQIAKGIFEKYGRGDAT